MNDLMQYFYKIERDGTSPKPRVFLNLWGGVLLAIRRDLGIRNTKLSSIDMLRSQIKDIDNSAST